MYAAELSESNVVLRVIVGSAEWAIENLGGTWVESESKIGIDWVLFGDELRPPAPFASWIWSDGQWVSPILMPIQGEWIWDENSLSWLENL